MIASVALALTLQLGAGNPEPSAVEVPVVVPIEVQFDKSNAVIGEPIVFDLTLSPDDAEQWRLAPADALFAPEQGWLELMRDDRGESIRLTLAALEGGQRVPPLPLISRDGTDDVALLTWHTAGTTTAPFISIESALGMNEDALRPEVELRDVEFGPGGRRFVVGLLSLLGALLAGLVVLIVVLVRRSSRRSPRAHAVPEAAGLERLAQIEATSDASLARSQAFETTRILRDVIDERAGRSRAGATDSEWLSALDENLATEEQRRELEQLFAAVEAVKYGGATQTTFAQDELLVRARRLAREISTRPQETQAPETVEAA